MSRTLPILAAAALLATTGCSGPAEGAAGPDGTQPGAGAPADPSSVTPEPVPDGSGDRSSAPTADSGPRMPFTTLRGALEETEVFAQIYPIERGGATATANVRFSLVDPDAYGFRIHRSLSDNKPELGDSGETAPDGLRLIDQGARKAYLPATINDGECLCSPRTNGFTDRHHQVTISVTFAAPPASTTAIDLMVPGFGTVSDVPLR